MGFFSWITQDTRKSIANRWSTRKTFKVHMLDDKGNVWTEDNYNGYGEFGGKDYFELLSEMNGGPSDRNVGIDMAYGSDKVKHPNLVKRIDWEYIDEAPDSCDKQGFFY